MMIKKIRSNWKSGFTIALISIPLSISLAVASNVSPVQGIITAIWAGLIASLFGGSNFNIIGPTGALSGVIASFVLSHGIESVNMLALATGVMILIAYLLRVEKYLIFIPSSVIHGFTLGIACIIIFNQINFAFGLRNIPMHTDLIHTIWESLTHISGMSLMAFLVFVTFFIGLFLLRKLFPLIPAAAVISPLGILLGYKVSSLNIETLGSRYGNVSMKLFQLPSFYFSSSIIWPAFIIALIAILETMLSAKIADSLTKTKHKSHQELLGLSLANIGSGLAGGIPATAALARTILNIKTGATDKMSATLSSIFIIVLSSICLPYFKYMPLAIIAAMLVHIAIGMIEREHFVRLFRYDKINFSISILVATITVYKDPIIGILGGAIISLLFFIEKLSHGYYELIEENINVHKHDHDDKNLAARAKEADVLIYTFKGKLSYLNIQAHVARFETDFDRYNSIILNMEEVFFIDIDGIDAIDEIIDILHKKNKQVVMTAINPLIKKLFIQISPHYSKLEEQGLVFEKIDTALHFLQVKLNKKI